MKFTVTFNEEDIAAKTAEITDSAEPVLVVARSHSSQWTLNVRGDRFRTACRRIQAAWPVIHRTLCQDKTRGDDFISLVKYTGEFGGPAESRLLMRLFSDEIRSINLSELTSRKVVVPIVAALVKLAGSETRQFFLDLKTEDRWLHHLARKAASEIDHRGSYDHLIGPSADAEDQQMIVRYAADSGFNSPSSILRDITENEEDREFIQSYQDRLNRDR